MSKAARQRSARDRLAEERARQAKRDQRMRAVMIGLSALVVVAVVVVVTVIVKNNKAKRNDKAVAYTGQLAPLSRQADGSILMAQKNVTAPKLEIFEDFQCPICNEFEKSSGQTVKKLAAEGKVSVAYYPFWLFKQQPQPISGNSQRAALAALCAPADKWVSYHDTIYKYQPEEGSKGFSNADLTNWAKDLGFGDAAFTKCLNDKAKQPQLDSMTNYAEQTRKVSGTPTVFLNGQSLDLNKQLLNPGGLEQAVAAAAATKPSTTPTPGK